MKRVTGILAMVCAASLSVSVSAQWLKYPTAGVPRTADGRPDLNAPTPRTADGKPDLSGIWDIEHNRPCPPGGCLDMPIGEEFVNIGWGVKGGLPLQPWAAAILKERTEQNGKDDPATHCRPGGIINIPTTPLF